jgi:hypothetical protein
VVQRKTKPRNIEGKAGQRKGVAIAVCQALLSILVNQKGARRSEMGHVFRRQFKYLSASHVYGKM